MSHRRFVTRILFALVGLWILLANAAPASAVGDVRVMKPDGSIHFVLQDNLDHPFYWWPKTLLSYPVRFEAPGVLRNQLALSNAADRSPITMQLSGVKEDSGRVTFAWVNFISDLPSNGRRDFVLSSKSPLPSTMPSSLPIVSDTQRIEVDTGAVKVRLPASQTFETQTLDARQKGGIPGPIIELCRFGGHWMGHSVLVSPKRRVLKLETAPMEVGPLFAEYRVTYTFDRDATYTAIVRCVAGEDFVNIRDETDGLTAADDVYVDQQWTDFHPTHREAPNHLTAVEAPARRSAAAPFVWETIDQALVGTAHGVNPGLTAAGEMPFRLGPYQPWGAFVSLNFANFWDERSGDAVGLFINDSNQWQDHEYAIWMSSDTLQIRYFYSDGVMSWHWPLITGTRSVSIAAYDHQKDLDKIRESQELAQRGISVGKEIYKSKVSPMSYVGFLSVRYGILDLNTIKDWVLAYPETARHQPLIFDAPQSPTTDIASTEPETNPAATTEPATMESSAAEANGTETTARTPAAAEPKQNEPTTFEKIDRKPAALIRTLWQTELVRDLPMFGVRQNAGFNPVSSRELRTFVVAYNRTYSEMSPEQRKKIEAMYLLIAYLDAGEEVMPMQNMLAGHPNFLADIKTVPALMAMLFPDHPMAREWSDEFERFVDLNARYHTRPPVSAWNAKGGRWTENLGTYTWAAMRPTISAVWALREYFDGRNRYCNEQSVEMGNWLVDALTAPFSGDDLPSFKYENGKRPPHSWGMVTLADGLRRMFLPQGAHSERRMPPRVMWLFGSLLEQYAPLTAEHLMWAAHPRDDDMESFKTKYDPWSVMYPRADNRGTNPHLKSEKYTGYGIVMRSAVDTPKEVSLHLQQIDSGPNYRWGAASEGGCGLIYYYAGGKAYSHNGTEDVGDRAVNDTDFCCDFGVYKDGHFKGIGRNVLDSPFYDLGTAQLAEITPRQSPDAYSWPEYKYRRVMLVGSDYGVVYDSVFSNAIATRFSWFVDPKDDLPKLISLKDVRHANKTTNITTAESKGVWFDGMGDSEMLLTHLPDVAADPAKPGLPTVVTTSHSVDHVFFDANPIDYRDRKSAIAFSGTAGVVREFNNGSTELSLFHGQAIADRGVAMSIDGDSAAISAHFTDPTEIAGIFSCPAGGCTLTLSKAVPSKESPTTAAENHPSLYVDGRRVDYAMDASALHVKLPAGRHSWQLTDRLPAPQQPTVIRTEDRSGATNVIFSQSNGATTYQIELSQDGGHTWRNVGNSPQTSFEIAGLSNGTKVHVRVIGLNDDRESEPSDEYPVYVTDAVPHSPDGLQLVVTAGKAALHWGEVLGVTEYRLFVRQRGAEQWQCIYQGLGRQFTDDRPGIIPPFSHPGVAANMLNAGPPYTVYEYAVSAVNGNGESLPCRAVDTDPKSWLNWDPRPGEGYRRVLNYNVTPFVAPDSTPPYYPN